MFFSAVCDNVDLEEAGVSEIDHPPIDCGQINCLNGGVCLILAIGSGHRAICNCTDHWTGERCERPAPEENPCSTNRYCQHDGICHLDAYGVPQCTCVGEWHGDACENPPRCQDKCGQCRTASAINECLYVIK